jgi:hypothetical protein
MRYFDYQAGPYVGDLIVNAKEDEDAMPKIKALLAFTPVYAYPTFEEMSMN